MYKLVIANGKETIYLVNKDILLDKFGDDNEHITINDELQRIFLNSIEDDIQAKILYLECQPSISASKHTLNKLLKLVLIYPDKSWIGNIDIQKYSCQIILDNIGPVTPKNINIIEEWIEHNIPNILLKEYFRRLTKKYESSLLSENYKLFGMN